MQNFFLGVLKNNMNYFTNSNISFNGRCPQIKDAQWVCHNINSNFPHISITRRIPAFKKIINDNPELSVVPKSLYSMSEILKTLVNMKESNFFKWSKLEKYNKIQSLINYSIKSITSFAQARIFSNYMFNGNKFLVAIDMITNSKLGNCGEESIFTDFILKLNGVKNACIVDLKNPSNNIRHSVCVFNRDGSKFEKVINNKTIVVDTWAGKVDFANNLIPFYKYQCKNYFGIKPDEKLEFVFYKQYDIPEKDLNEYIKNLPDIFFKKKQK